MRSLVIIEIEHADDDTDEVENITEAIDNGAFTAWIGVEVNDYAVRVDLPDCFKLA